MPMGKAWWFCGVAALALSASEAGAVTFTFTGSVQNWVAPRSGSYLITAQGGAGSGNGGSGAIVSARFLLPMNAALDVVVAGNGGNPGGGGGGASWIYGGSQLLMVAGGGGGGGLYTGGGDASGIGGSGLGGTGANYAGGGAGAFSDGTGGYYGTAGGMSRPSFAGGAGNYNYGNGGFGGGGGVGVLVGGGGAGFTGGNSGFLTSVCSPIIGCGYSPNASQGGTSYVAAGGQSASYGVGSTFGLVTISAVPEPKSWALLIAGFIAVGGALRARRVTVARA
jgi:hypothetical protein